MRNILNLEDVMYKKDFFVWFIMNCFPEGIDEENDMSIYDVIEENYSFDMDWFNELTNFYEGVFEDNDGYTDNPNSFSVYLNNNNELSIEFHPRDVIFFMNDSKIGCTEPDYSIKTVSFSKYLDLTEGLSYESQLFLLPMVEVKECEKIKFKEIVENIISKLNIEKSCEKQIVEIIINNCLG